MYVFLFLLSPFFILPLVSRKTNGQTLPHPQARRPFPSHRPFLDGLDRPTWHQHLGAHNIVRAGRIRHNGHIYLDVPIPHRRV